MSADAGWLVSQLPRAMVADPVLRGFVTAFEEVADTVRARLDSIEHQVDTGLATPEMLQYLASWLGLVLEPTDPLPLQRALVHEVGRLLGWRGTRHGVEGLLEAATGARVTVTDGGGVFGVHDDLPPPDPVVRVRLDHTGHLTERQVHRFLEAEVPLGARVELDVRYPSGPGRGTPAPDPLAPAPGEWERGRQRPDGGWGDTGEQRRPDGGWGDTGEQRRPDGGWGSTGEQRRPDGGWGSTGEQRRPDSGWDGLDDRGGRDGG